MQFQIKNRFSRAVIFECELPDKMADALYEQQLGYAVIQAYRSGADLSWADLRWADLRGAKLRGAKLREANLCNANFCDANLCGADLRGARLPDGVPLIPNIHDRVYAAASRPGALDMTAWHTCLTTHCRAGWVVTIAGDAGRDLEQRFGTSAAALIYMASDPDLPRVPDFYSDNEAALADMRRLAGDAIAEATQ